MNKTTIPAASNLTLVPKSLKSFKCDNQWATLFAGQNWDTISKLYPKLADVKVYWKRKGNTADYPLQQNPKSTLIIGSAIKNLDQAVRTYTLKTVQNPQPDHSVKEQADLEEAGFEWVMDNGYLDYLATTTPTEKAPDTINSYLTDLMDMTSEQGSVVFFTLGFDVGLANLVRFYREKNVSLHLVPLKISRDSGSSHPVFMLVIKKGVERTEEEATMTVVNFAWDSKITPTFKQNYIGIFRTVRDIRMQLFYQVYLTDYHQGQLQFFDVIDDSTAEKKVAYQMTLYDRVTDAKKIKHVKSTVAILVPLADQHHWLYKTGHGHQRLAERAGCLRILCVFLPDFGELAGEKIHPIQTVEKIKRDLGSKLVELSVDTSQPVLLMTQQEKFEDERIVVRQTESEFAGKILVFDALVDKDDEELHGRPDQEDTQKEEQKGLQPSEFTRRTMIFECSPRSAQTEAWYRKVDGKEQMVYEHICHSYHLMVLAAFLTVLMDGPKKGSVIGIGGGVLSSMLKYVFGKSLSLENVDIDPTVVDVAKQNYFFEESDTNSVVIDDGFQYVSRKEGSNLDFILVDINGVHDGTSDYSHGVTTPPERFYSEEFLTKLKNAIKEDGVIMFNVVCQTDSGRAFLGRQIRKVFSTVCSFKLTRDYNEVVLATNKSLPSIADIDTLIENLRSLLLSKEQAYPSLRKIVETTPLYLSDVSTSRAACLPM